MIQTEAITIGEKQYIRTYSDRGMMIHGGVPEGDYDEAIDPAELGRTYVETDIPIEGDETEAEEIVSILTGESE
jgi:hypothetical protein